MERLRKCWRGFIENVRLFNDTETEEEIRQRQRAEMNEVEWYLNQCVRVIDTLLERADGLIFNYSRMNELKFRITKYMEFTSNKWMLCPLNIRVDDYLPTSYIWKDNRYCRSTNLDLAILEDGLKTANEMSEQFWRKTSLKKRIQKTLCSKCSCVY